MEDKEKYELRKKIVELYAEYLKELDKWNNRASQYGGHKEPTFEGFMDWLNYDFIR